MATIQRDLLIQQGATFSFSEHIDDVAHHAGYTARMKCRAQHAATSTMFAIDSVTNPTEISFTAHGAHGDIGITLAATKTAGFSAPWTGVYDIELQETATGIVLRILEGSVYITPESTR
jgi:hypothetical protein